MTTRACFIIGPTKLCGPTAIVGSNCPRSPFWTIHCNPIVLSDIACATPPFVDEPALTLVLTDQTPVSAELEDPGVVVAP